MSKKNVYLTHFTGKNDHRLLLWIMYYSRRKLFNLPLSLMDNATPIVLHCLREFCKQQSYVPQVTSFLKTESSFYSFLINSKTKIVKDRKTALVFSS